jgi:hypothetical protein
VAIVKPSEFASTKETAGCTSICAASWYDLTQETAQFIAMKPDYAAALGMESEGPCKDEYRSHTKDAGNLIRKVLKWCA